MRPIPAATVLAALALSALPGCAAVGTAIGGRELDVQTKVGDSIFLDPVPPEARTVYVEVKNTSDKADLDIGPLVRRELASRGWRVTADPADARYLLQANLLQAGHTAKTAAQLAYRGGALGSVGSGAVVGGAGGYLAGRTGGIDGTVATLGGALAGAAVATAADSYVQKVTYALVTDVQLSERAPPGLAVAEATRAVLPQGQGGSLTQTSAADGPAIWRRYRTRVVSTAERTNLGWEEAAPQLAAGLGRSVAGLL